MKKLLPSLVLLAGALLSSVTHAGDLPATIRFGEVGGIYVKNVGGKPQDTRVVALAEHLHLFEREFGPGGPKIEQIFFAGAGPAQNEALAQGAIDFGTYGNVPNVIGLSGRIPAHIIATWRSVGLLTFYLAVRADSPYGNLADLRGRRVTVPKGTNPHLSLVQLLEAQGLRDGRDITITNLPGAEGLAAFNAGAVDAVLGGVNLLPLRDQKQVRILADTRGVDQATSRTGLLVTDAFAQQYPEAVTRVVKVLLEAAHWASQESNREALLQFVAARSVEYRYVRENYAGALREHFNPLIDESSVAAYVEAAKFAVANKLIRKEPDVATVRSWFAPQYQQAALQQLQLTDYWQKSGALLQTAAH